MLWEGNPVGPPLMSAPPVGTVFGHGMGIPRWAGLDMSAWGHVHVQCSKQADWLELSLCAHLYLWTSCIMQYYDVLPSVLYGELVCRSHLYLSWLQYWRFSAEFSAYLRELCPNGKKKKNFFLLFSSVWEECWISAPRAESVWSSRGDGSI